MRPGPSQPRGGLPVAFLIAAVVIWMSAFSSGTFCMLRWVKPWPMNSHLRSSAAFTIGGNASMAQPLIASTPGIWNSSNTFTKRQKPTRLPYSCQHQFGMSGDGAPPAGGVSTVRGITSFGSHSSTLTITHTAMRAPPGNFSGGRSVIAE